MTSMVHRFFTTAAIAAALFTINVARSQDQETTTLGGYGELHYNEPDGRQHGTLDFHRFVIYLAHTFNDKISLKSEVEIEHTKIESPNQGEVAIEQAYVDWHLSKAIGLKAGIILPPVGIINQYHEPPTFFGVERPLVDEVIIPSTWRESGAGIYGSLTEGLNYQLYVVAGLLSGGFSADEGIREGRQEALESTTNNPSLTGRLDYVPMPELRLGGSFFAGKSNDAVDALGSGMVSLISGDAQYNSHGFALRGEGTLISISDADKINAAYGNNVGDKLYGFYLEGGYNVLPYIDATAGDQSLSPFLRYEKLNTQSAVTGFLADPANDRSLVTVGASYKPTFNTVFKLDYQIMTTAAGGNSAKQLNMGVGYNF